MNIGTVAGFITVVAVGIVLWKVIQKKCQKEVKVYAAENISYPKDKGTGGTKPRLDNTESGSDNGIADKPGTGKVKERKSVQVKSSSKSEQFKRKNDRADKAVKPDSIRAPRVQPI